jgi:hypothetical protein
MRLSAISLCSERLVSREIIVGENAECRVRRCFPGHTHYSLPSPTIPAAVAAGAGLLQLSVALRVDLSLGGWPMLSPHTK